MSEIYFTKNNVKKRYHFFRILMLAVLAWLCGQPHQAGAVESDIPVQARVVLSKAISLMNKNAYDDAIGVLNTFQARGDSLDEGEPDHKGYHHARIYYTLGTCHLFKGNYRKAAEAYHQTLEKNPAFISAWLNLARANYELGNFLETAKCFNEAYDRAPEKDPGHLYFCATAFLMAKRNTESVAAFKRLFKNHPGAIQTEWLENYVQALLTDGRTREALPHLKRLVESVTEKERTRWQEILLNQYMHLDMWKEAHDYVQGLTKDYPAVSKWWKAMAHIYLQEGESREALAALIIYGYLTPLTDEEAKLVADLYLMLGIPVKAVPVYEVALEKNPDCQLVQKLMQALRQLGKFEQALEVIERFAPDSGDTDLLMLKADLQYSLKRFGDAARTYRQIARTEAQQSKKAGRAWLMAGYAALQADDIDGGRKAFAQAVAFESQRKAALSAMERIAGRSPPL